MPENPNTNRTHATLRLWGKHLDPDDVTRRLRCVPSEYHRLGDRRGKSGTWSHGYWALYSEHQVRSTDLALHLEWLLDHIEPVQSQLAALMAEDIHADFFCFWESLTGHGGPNFSPALLRRLGAVGLELGLDIYFAS